MLITPLDNDNIEIFKQQIKDFRKWMWTKGERDKPLIISEYGILMPEVWGFDYDRVKTFMIASFDYLTTATHDSWGYPPDDNKLVQRWVWYSLNDDDFEDKYPSHHHLFDPTTKQITALGLDYRNYIVPGDLDGDGDVDVEDIMLVASRWRTSCDIPDPDYDPDTGNYHARYDFDDDCDIDIVDIMLVVVNWGKTRD